MQIDAVVRGDRERERGHLRGKRRRRLKKCLRLGEETREGGRVL